MQRGECAAMSFIPHPNYYRGKAGYYSLIVFQPQIAQIYTDFFFFVYIAEICGKNIFMAYNEKMADRVREIIDETHNITEEKKMFGGLCFMVNDKMCVGVESERIMVRIDPAVYDEVMEKDGCTPIDFTGKVMKGYIFVDAAVLKTKKQLDYWVQLALAFNKLAKSSKKKAKK
jgi:TfoX/Sxy family transcriptional regulator of competence genes